MIIKILGLGPKMYVRDYFNIFDAFIVILSIVDVSLTFSIEDNFSNAGKGAISAFRAFRLMRVFKLAKSWTQLNKLIQTILNSLKDISSFSVLLFLLIYIYILLGMQIFARYNKLSTVDPDLLNMQKQKNRSSFDTFFEGFIVVFTILTGENWDETMIFFTRQYGYSAMAYFFSLIIIGVMIFLNLFLAILLENFDMSEESDS